MSKQEVTSIFLDGLIQEFVHAGANLKRLSDKDLDVITEVCNQKDYIIWINSHDRIEPVLINDPGKKFYGFTKNDLRASGFELYKKFLDPDHFGDLHKTIQYFHQNPSGVLKMTYRVRKSSGDWCWTYSLAKAIAFSKDRKPTLVLAVVYDIEDLLINGSGKSTNDLLRYKKLYNKLTSREKQVLHYIANEHTSHEIAEILHIEATTVDTHRKRIIKKLGAKSSLGLVKYALMFEELE